MDIFRAADVLSEPLKAIMVINNWSEDEDTFRKVFGAYMYVFKASKEWPTRVSSGQINDREIAVLNDHVATLNNFFNEMGIHNSDCCLEESNEEGVKNEG